MPRQATATPARAVAVATVLDRMRRAASVLDALSLAGDLVASAAQSTRPELDCSVLVEATRELADGPTAIAAVHALGRLAGSGPDDRLAELIGPAGGWLTPHAAWALGRRPPREDILLPLARLVEQGWLAGMLAQQALAEWAGDRPEPVARALAAQLRGTPSGNDRARLVETLGLVRGTAQLLATIAADGAEPVEARVAALASLGDRGGALPGLVQTIARGDDPAAEAARLALLDRELRVMARTPTGDGALRVAQLHLGGRLDPALTHAGEGDTGGIATLLVQLGDALARDPRVEAVTTIGHGSAAEAIAAFEAVEGPHAVMPVPLGSGEGSSFAERWPARVAAGRGLRRILRRRPATVLHLRMADVGSLAGADVAREEGLPIVFTLAPDPQAVIAGMEKAGELDRASFGPADVQGGLWFRACLVARLARAARQVVLFPRPALAARLRDLVGIDVEADPGRYWVIPEGIDLGPVRAARAAVAGPAGDTAPPVVADLRDAIAALGPARRALPIVISVGRLIEVKGMARIVEAFAADPELFRRANLVIVGGNLDDPSPAERAEIERIEATVVGQPELAQALVLLGHRPHDDVLLTLAVARAGLAAWIAAGGAYACGSRKEEFGLAIVEALAVGLPVVAPRAGGPASYVEDGITGRLVDTLDRGELAVGIRGALDLAAVAGRAQRAERLVEERFTIDAMAGELVPVYAASRLPVEAVGAAGGAPGALAR